MQKSILISGFGGQGMIKLGKIMAEAALQNYRHISWFPSYGAEMRGGTAHCSVKISDQPIATPFIKSPDIAVIFNQPSFDKFRRRFHKKTLVVLNGDLIQNFPKKLEIKDFFIFPLNKIALSCGNIKVANIVALGAILSLTNKLFNEKDIISLLKKNFSDKDKQVQNLKALAKGKNLC